MRPCPRDSQPPPPVFPENFRRTRRARLSSLVPKTLFFWANFLVCPYSGKCHPSFILSCERLSIPLIPGSFLWWILSMLDSGENRPAGGFPFPLSLLLDTSVVPLFQPTRRGPHGRHPGCRPFPSFFQARLKDPGFSVLVPFFSDLTLPRTRYPFAPSLPFFLHLFPFFASLPPRDHHVPLYFFKSLHLPPPNS